MITDLWLIGIGTGSPVHVTLEGVQALREAAAILLPQKGENKDDLALIRQDILNSVGSTAQVLPFDMPVRNESLPYQERVVRWHDEIALRWMKTARSAQIDGPIGLMVWGDPGLYDSTLRIAERLHPYPNMRVVPGITALQALTAAHSIPFNTIDGAVAVTTGRRLRTYGLPEGAETTVVMLDGACGFQTLTHMDLTIWWGAYLGMPNQIVASGPLADTASEIVTLREHARAQHGWIMDTYLLRRT